MSAHLTITRPGISYVTDLGRPGAGRVGQMTAGALDQYSVRVANTLVAADEHAPLLEVVAADFAMVTSVNLLIAVTGAPADVAVSGVPVPQWEPFLWPAGSQLTVTNMRVGMRVYVAIHGSLAVPRLLGSCAPDSVLGFSGPLRRDDRVEVDPSSLLIDYCYFGVPVFRVGAVPSAFGDRWEIPVTDGPDRDQFGATADRLHRGLFVVGDKSNHIGLRLTPGIKAVLPVRERSDEILSRGVPIGAVEVPAGNELLVLHRGRGVTAGYPVLAVVTTVGLSRLGQVRSGQSVSFPRVSVEDAVAAARAERWAIDQLRRRLVGVLEAHGLRPQALTSSR